MVYETEPATGTPWQRPWTQAPQGAEEEPPDERLHAAPTTDPVEAAVPESEEETGSPGSADDRAVAEWEAVLEEADLDDAEAEDEARPEDEGEGEGEGEGEDPAVRAPTPTPATQLGKRIAAIADQECKRWGDGRRTETDPAMTPVLQDYYRTGVGRTVAAADLQSAAWQKREPWSAVFVSWVMSTAGATTFPRRSAHRSYLGVIKGRTEKGETSSEFWLHPLDRVVPEVGDLLCADRPCRDKAPCNGATYENVDNGHSWCAHCDIVTRVDRAGRTVHVVGGNVSESVKCRKYNLDAQGFVLPHQGRCGHFAIAKVRETGVAGSSGTPPSAGGGGSFLRLLGLLGPDQLAKAMRLNRSYGGRLGWRNRVDAVARLLGGPQLTLDEATFAYAVARWQSAHGLAGDGVLGPDTWAAMRRLLDSGQSTAGIPAPTTGVPALGGPRVPPASIRAAMARDCGGTRRAGASTRRWRRCAGRASSPSPTTRSTSSSGSRTSRPVAGSRVSTPGTTPC